MDKIIWENLCDAVESNISLAEMPFEKSVAITFLGALGWNSMLGNLKEQYVMGHTNWRADFALFAPGKNNPEIIVELKKPQNKQNSKNREQVSDYLKLKDCRFGLYFGEKLELFYLANVNEDERELKSVLTVEYVKNSPYSIELLSLLRNSTYNREKLMNYCNEQLAIKEACKYWQTQDGLKELKDMMMKHSKLKKELSDRFFANIDVHVKARSEVKGSHTSIFSMIEDVHSKQNSIVPEGEKLSKPRFQFWMAGLKEGDTVIFAPTGVEVTVVPKNKIEYQGKKYSLTGFCSAFMPDEQRHLKGSYEGPAYFTYNGKTLKQIRNEKEKEGYRQ